MKGREKAISLIKKVLAKGGNNNNEHEVEVAMLKAQELLAKYGLSMEDISDSEHNKKEVLRNEVESGGRNSWWKSRLGIVIADNFRCEIFTNGANRNLMFIGLKEDTEIAKELFYYMKDSVEICAKNYAVNLVNEINETKMKDRKPQYQKWITLKDVNGEKNDYIRGFIEGIGNKLSEQKERNGWGLILAKDDCVTEYVSKLRIKKGRRSSTQTSGDKSHFEKGFADGKSLKHDKNQLKG